MEEISDDVRPLTLLRSGSLWPTLVHVPRYINLRPSTRGPDDQPEVSQQERLKLAALRVQMAFRTQRFHMAEQAYRDGVKAGAQWIQRVIGLPAYASRIVSEFAILGSLPVGLPVLLHRRDGHFILSFPEDLPLALRREYARKCSLSSQPILKLSGKASIKAFDECARHAADQPSPPRRRHSRDLLYGDVSLSSFA